MNSISIKYGNSSVDLAYDAERFDVVSSIAPPPPISDVAIGEAFDSPIGSERIEDIVGDGDTVLIAVPDATRECGAGQIVNLLVRRLIAGGTPPYNIAIIFSTGIHRKVTDEEKSSIVTPFIAQRIKMLDHDPRDLMRLIKVGETPDGISVELSRAVAEYDHLVLVGGISFHYFAGFTGGRKLVCPGLAGNRTIAATHRLAFDIATRDRRDGVEPGRLDGNAVHNSFIDATRLAKPAIAFNTFVDEHGRVTDLYCGDWIMSHEAACREFARRNTVVLHGRRDVVIAGCGGSPFDINLIQAHKSLDVAAAACRPGGTIILFAECAEGLGKDKMQKWFELGSSDAMADRLVSGYEVNGQTAWAFRRKTEMFDVRMITSLDDDLLNTIGVKRAESSDAENLKGSGYIIHAASKLLIRTPPV